MAQSPQVSVSLTPATPAIAGQPFTMIVRMQIEKDWHVYWENPGDSGVPTVVEWKLPDGWKAGPLQFPTPTKYVSTAGVAYGHAGEVLFLTEITPAATASGPAEIGAVVDWLACKEACIPGSAEVSTHLTVGPSGFLHPQARQLYTKARAGMPFGDPLLAEASGNDQGVDLTVRLPDVKEAYFFASAPDTAAPKPEMAITPIEDGFRMVIPKSPYAKEPPKRLIGVLAVTLADGKTKSYRLDIPIQRNEGGIQP